jgi:hypothetical protein
MIDDGNFLSRWSKRKREALSQPAAEAEAPVGEGAEGRQTQADEGEEQPFDLSLLPDLETLTGESDIQSFLHQAVPDALRNAALRKVWALDPAVRNYVGEALDYAYDWNAPGGVPGFGEILSDEQSVAFVRNLLAGPDSDEKVIEDAAARQDHAPPAHTQRVIGEQDSEASDKEIQSPEKVDFIEADDMIAGPSEAISHPQRKPKHGGALPI